MCELNNPNFLQFTNLVPSLEQDTDVTERFTNKLRDYNDLTFTELVHRLKLPSLELHRQVNDLTWCYKIVFGNVDTQSDGLFELSTVAQSSGHQYKLCQNASRGLSAIAEFLVITFYRSISIAVSSWHCFC